MKKVFLSSFFLLCIFCATAQIPVINSFTPEKGEPGITVSISGNNFSSVNADNIVYFGSVRATVIASTETLLTVTAPFGATYQPVSVTVNRRTAYSSNSFSYTFADGGNIKAEYFGQRQELTTGSHPNDIVAIDFDGDGKPDLATPNNFSTSSGSVSILKNTSTPGQIIFSPAQHIIAGAATYSIAAADLDGDGKVDIISSSTAEQNISIFKNISTPGNINFTERMNYLTGDSPYGIATGDFNGDGKVDIAVVNNFSSSVSVFKNTSIGGNISFENHLEFNTPLFPACITAGDVDSDGMTDIVVGTEFSKLYIIKNQSSLSAIFFGEGIEYTTPNKVTCISLSDLNNDSKPELAVSISGNMASSQSFIYQNTSIPGDISFSSNLVALNTGANCNGVAINDINGDGKPDVLIQNNMMNIAQNTGTGSNLEFVSPLVKINSLGLNRSIIVDLDADGKNDLAGSQFTSNSIFVHRNKFKEPYFTQFSPSTATEGQQVDINGGNFIGTTAISFGNVPARSFYVVNDNQITAIVDSGSTGDISVTNAFGTGNIAGFIFKGFPKIYSFSPSSADYGSMVTINGANFMEASSVSFGGTPALSFRPVSMNVIVAYVGTGSSGNVKVASIDTSGSLGGFTYIPSPKILSAAPMRAAAGAVITIKGVNLLGITSIRFGDVPARAFTIVSKDTIKAVVDSGASGAIIITGPSGADTLQGFTYIPKPTITAISPVDCIQGTPLTITGSNFSEVQSVYIGGLEFTNFYVLVSPDTIRIPSMFGNAGKAEIKIITTGGEAIHPGPSFYIKPVNVGIFPHYGNSGDTISINGGHLFGVSEVKFGGIPARSFVYHNNGWLTATIGAGASGPVTVTNFAGTFTYDPTFPGHNFKYVNVPKIDSFYPQSGEPGTVVTIRGKNFSNSAAKNIVKFGSIKANIIICDSNAIKVKVPEGVTYDRVSVTNLDLHLTAYNDIPFTLTFSSDSAAFSNSSFTGEITATNAFKPGVIATGDIDGDGRMDILAANHTQLSLSILRNIGTGGELLFAPSIDSLAGLKIHQIDLDDMNGDGKTDIIALDVLGNSAAFILINTSQPGQISFLPRFRLGAPQITSFSIGDLNHDGKPDVAFTSSATLGVGINSITEPIYTNTSTGGILSFNSQISDYFVFNTATATDNFWFKGTAIRDFNKDGLVDLVVGNDGDALFKLPNNGVYDYTSLRTTAASRYASVRGKVNPIPADLDGDGWCDILTPNHINQNTGNFQFTAINTINPSETFKTIGNLNGDKKPDIIERVANTNQLKFKANNSSPGTIQFTDAFVRQVDTLIPTNNIFPYIADADGDGKADILISNYSRNKIVILKNITVKKQAIRICILSDTTLSSNLSGSSNQWQISSDGINFTNLLPGANYNGTTSRSLQIQNIPAATGGKFFRCITDGLSSDVFKMELTNIWTGHANSVWENVSNWSCGILPDANTNVIIESGNPVINSNVTINSLVVSPGVNFSVNTGYQLTIIH